MPMKEGRTVVVGDVHGCCDELQTLLDRIAFHTGDRLVFAGDLVARGPNSRGVLQIARRTGAIVVRGNHDAKILSYREAMKDKKRPPVNLGKNHQSVVESLTDPDWAVLETSSLWVDLPEHDVRVVHAGLIPGIPIEKQDPKVLLHVRTVADGALWGERYAGPPHVIFGHNAVEKLQIHPWATGLDTGCVYGGKLSALVLEHGERVPQDRAKRLEKIVSVPAARVYYDPITKNQVGP
ncbi:metallophosphoesterase [Pendulispora brunnea]|uniref:Metallophosphoesterase n=1 Tax=Pendulispora brunnea TaxID=2905690 RepID=A0ABZ2KI52_9BACT